jgi:hypothetical protein
MSEARLGTVSVLPIIRELIGSVSTLLRARDLSWPADWRIVGKPTLQGVSRDQLPVGRQVDHTRGQGLDGLFSSAEIIRLSATRQ